MSDHEKMPDPEHQAQLDKLRESARGIAESLDRRLTFAHGHKIGFSLFLFEFGDAPQMLTYVSNAVREDMIKMVEEWLAREKAR